MCFLIRNWEKEASQSNTLINTYSPLSKHISLPLFSIPTDYHCMYILYKRNETQRRDFVATKQHNNNTNKIMYTYHMKIITQQTRQIRCQQLTDWVLVFFTSDEWKGKNWGSYHQTTGYEHATMRSYDSATLPPNNGNINRECEQ